MKFSNEKISFVPEVAVRPLIDPEILLQWLGCLNRTSDHFLATGFAIQRSIVDTDYIHIEVALLDNPINLSLCLTPAQLGSLACGYMVRVADDEDVDLFIQLTPGACEMLYRRIPEDWTDLGCPTAMLTWDYGFEWSTVPVFRGDRT